MPVHCPHCRALVGGAAPQGGLKINGLSITLVKADGRVHGPCKRCKGDVVLVEGGQLSKSISEATPPSSGRGRRLVLVLGEEKPQR